MKGSSVIISVIALIAVAVLYVLYFTDNAGMVAENEPAAQRLSETGGEVRIAYVKADSILLNYSLAQDLHDEFTKKQEAYNTEYSDKRQTFEKEAAAFQEKLQRGGFLTEQRAVQERDRLVSKEQEIMQLDQDLSSRLAEMQTANNRQILDSLMNYLKDYNRNNKYDYILNGSSVLMGKDAHNLTGEVLDALNERYLGEGE
ncbi:MAG: OmpH family outer membrane protein [Prolixibacteraceae bacterium]